METTYSVVEKLGRSWAKYEQRYLGAVSVSKIRAYTFPLFTPAGANVLQDNPPDHLHHQGIEVGQDYLNGHNFWAMGSVQFPLNFQHQESVQHAADPTGITVVQQMRWTTNQGQAVMQEERRTRFEAWDGLNFVEITSIWKADYGDLYLAKTKEGGLAMRVHPQLETFWGGQIRSSTGKIGEKEIFDTQADWIEVAGIAEGRAVGVVMMPHPSQPQLPWFVRDYGLHNYSPYRHAPARIPAGNSVSLRVGFATYDGRSDGSQAARAWKIYSVRTS